MVARNPEKIRVRPITLREANAFVEAHHRHHKPKGRHKAPFLYSVRRSKLVTPVLLEDVVGEFDELGIHAVHDAVRRARHGTHYLVDEPRVRLEDALEGFAIE